MRACEPPFNSSQAQEHSTQLGVRVPWTQGPPPAWLPTPDSIADTNLAALMRDFQVRGEQVFPNRLGGIPFVCHVACRLSLSRQGARGRQGLVPIAQALALVSEVPRQRCCGHSNMAMSGQAVCSCQALLKLGG